MGFTYVDAVVYNRETSRSKKVRLLVDTGSTYTWVAKQTVEELSVQPERRRIFKTVDGRTVKRWLVDLPIEIGKEKAVTVVVLAERKDAEVLGVHALEGLGMEVDPTTGKLRRVRAILAV